MTFLLHKSCERVKLYICLSKNEIKEECWILYTISGSDLFLYASYWNICVVK